VTRKIKTLGAALVTVVALTAVMASAASATEFTASKYSTTGTATSAKGNDVFTTEGGTVKCASHFEGTLTESSPILTVRTNYTECEAFGFLSATVSTGSCTYDLKWPWDSGDTYSVDADISCGYEGAIIITAGTCKVRIGSQFTDGSVAVTNNTAYGDILIRASVTGIEYSVTQDGFLCPFSGTGPKYGATYSHGESLTFDSTNGANIHVG
jgi:hypothetical protein